MLWIINPLIFPKVVAEGCERRHNCYVLTCDNSRHSNYFCLPPRARNISSVFQNNLTASNISVPLLETKSTGHS